MRRITLLSASLAIGAALPLLAQHDTREGHDAQGSEQSSVVADAAMKGDLATVKKLIAQGADVNGGQGDGMTALHWAAEHGDSAMADALFKRTRERQGRRRTSAVTRRCTSRASREAPRSCVS